MVMRVSRSETETTGSVWGRVIAYIIIAIIVMGIIKWFFTQGVDSLIRATRVEGLAIIREYEVYANAIVLLLLGWLIVNSISQAFYVMMRRRYDESTAAAVRSLVRILGLGGLLAGIAGAAAGGAAGVALGGFIGMVVGFATQQVLGQAISGIFLLLARPFKIGDRIDVAGESDVVVKDITSMFTIVRRQDGLEVLIPSSMIIGQKIVIRKRGEQP